MLNSYFVRKDIMRDTIKEYIELSDKEKNDLWNTATFVFDTNVFLNLYRYSNKTRNQLIESFEWLNRSHVSFGCFIIVSPIRP